MSVVYGTEKFMKVIDWALGGVGQKWGRGSVRSVRECAHLAHRPQRRPDGASGFIISLCRSQNLKVQTRGEQFP